ncbi:MAG: metal ABC transporter substrate-binding protein [Ruminococcus sp.]|nr:metal ABC transporter substrate-binding protein [Ruminococcus sp.]
MLRKIISAAAALAFAVSISTGCSAQSRDDSRLSIVCTVYPLYDWTSQIVSGAPDTDLTYLMDNGADLHNYQPTADDMMTVSDCDVFIYVGGESDKWVDSALKNARNKDMKVIDLMDVLGSRLREEELKEGMQSTEEEEEDSGNEPEFDEHIWLSLRNAEDCTAAIASILSDADSEHAEIFKNNASAYIDELAALDDDYKELTDSAENRTLIFGDRFPFRYLLDDYGLDYYAAFKGCSSESEASFETVTFLAGKCDELGAEYVFTIDGSDCSIADAVIASTKSKSQKVLTLNSMQSVKAADGKPAPSYIELMTDNLNTLKEALN